MAIAAVDDELERKRLEERALNPLFGGNFMRVRRKETLLSDTLIMQSGDKVVGADYKGGDLMPFSPKDGELFNSMAGLVGKGQGIRYRLEVSDDKKSATITMEVNYDLMFRIEDACYDGYNACGNVKYSEQFKFDLSGDELKMTSHLTSQKIEP